MSSAEALSNARCFKHTEMTVQLSNTGLTKSWKKQQTDILLHSKPP